MTEQPASDLVVAVPEGTTVRDLDTGAIMVI